MECAGRRGHIILMSTNPMWRMNTSGLYALVMNAVMEMSQEPDGGRSAP